MDDQSVGSQTEPTNPPAKTVRQELLLIRYDKEIDLYKFYIDTAVKGSLFAFGVTGALLSFFFANRQKDSLLVWSLPLPIVLNVGFLVLFYSSIAASTKMMKDHKETCRELTTLEPFDTNPLPALCKILTCMYGLVCLGLVVVFFVYASKLR